MKLIKVSARNLKGLSFSLDLRAINFLVGSNFAGKSARTDAIRLLLLGFLPELGKLPRSTFEICSGRDLVVEGEFDNGLKLSRRWYLKGDAVKTEVDAPAVFDEQTTTLAAMLDASTYFALSDRERVAYVFANVPGLGRDHAPNRILESVLASVSAGDEAPDAKAVERFDRELDLARGTVERESGFAGWTPQTFLDFALEVATEAQKGARGRAAVFEKTTQGLLYLRTQEAPPAGSAALDARRGELAREIDELVSAKARDQAAFELGRSNRRRREELSLAIKARGSFDAQRGTFAAQIERLTAERDAIPGLPADEVETLRGDEREASNALADHTRQSVEIASAIARNEQELGDVNAKTKCPYCGAVGEGWKALKTAEIESALAGLRTKREQLEEHLVKLREHASRAAAALSRAKSNSSLRDGKDREIRTARQALDAVERQLAVLDGKAEELARIPAEDPTVVAAVEAAQLALNVKREELYRIEEGRRASIGRAHDLKRLAEAEKGRDESKVDEEVAKRAAAALRSVKETIVSEAFGPLLEVANSIFREVLSTPLSYRDGEIGTWRAGAWVGHRTFSGTEKALAYAAIQAALAARAPIRIMAIDELGRLDDGNAAKVASAVCRAVESGVVDQFVGIDAGRRSIYERAGELNGADLTVAAIQ